MPVNLPFVCVIYLSSDTINKYMNKNEKIIVITSAVFCAVGLMHLFRIVSGTGLSFGGIEVSIWASVVALIFIGFLVFGNITMIPVWTRSHWLLFISMLLFIDAGVTYYSYLSGLSYWYIPNGWFGFISLFEIMIASVLLHRTQKSKS